MNNLTALNQSAIMSSREIAELTGKRHDHVMRDCRAMFESLNIQSPQVWGDYQDGKGRHYQEAMLDKDLTMTLVMGYSTELRYKVAKRWRELEESNKPQLPTDYLSALKALTAEVEQRQQLESQLAIAAPKVEFVEKYVDSTGLFGFRQAAKTLKINERAFGEFLKSENIMYKLGGKWAAYSNHIDAGRFKVVTGTTQEGFAFVENKFTAKGIEWLAGKLKEAGKVK